MRDKKTKQFYYVKLILGHVRREIFTNAGKFRSEWRETLRFNIVLMRRASRCAFLLQNTSIVTFSETVLNFTSCQ